MRWPQRYGLARSRSFNAKRESTANKNWSFAASHWRCPRELAHGGAVRMWRSLRGWSTPRSTRPRRLGKMAMLTPIDGVVDPGTRRTWLRSRISSLNQYIAVSHTEDFQSPSVSTFQLVLYRDEIASLWKGLTNPPRPEQMAAPLWG